GVEAGAESGSALEPGSRGTDRTQHDAEFQRVVGHDVHERNRMRQYYSPREFGFQITHRIWDDTDHAWRAWLPTRSRSRRGNPEALDYDHDNDTPLRPQRHVGQRLRSSVTGSSR